MIALYTKIDPQPGMGVTDVIRAAQRLGITLVQFRGWTDSDLGEAGNHGSRWLDAQGNRAILLEIVDALGSDVTGWTAIYQTA